jgi:hypothetical protein
MAEKERLSILTCCAYSIREFFMGQKPNVKAKPRRGGPRPNSGRPRKTDSDDFIQVTCVLRRETVDRLKEGADSKFFGNFLQTHLDRFPVPSHEEYLAIREGMPLFKLIKRRKIPVLIAGQLTRGIKRPKSAAEITREKFRKEFIPV